MTKLSTTSAQNLRALRGRNGGFALTELLLTIGIIALVLGAVAAIAISTSAGQTAQSEARIIDSAASKIRNVYSSRADFAGLDLAGTIAIEAWPTNMVNGTEVYNAWGGLTTIQAAPAPTSYSGQAESRLFQIDVANVSQDACADLATAQTTALAVEVAGTPAYERGSATRDPIDNTVVTTNCGDGVTVSFIFGKNG